MSMSIPQLPWWPPDGSHEITEDEVRALSGRCELVLMNGHAIDDLH